MRFRCNAESSVFGGALQGSTIPDEELLGGPGAHCGFVRDRCWQGRGTPPKGDDRMADFISTLRDQQFTLATEISNSMAAQLKSKFRDALERKVREAGVPEAEIDEESIDLLLTQELLRDVMLAIQGYTDWLGTQLWRRRLKAGRIAEDEPLPTCDQRSQAAIVERYPVDGELLGLVIEALHQRSSELPAVGHVDGAWIRVDAHALARWAGYYDWSS